jgi:hypothetical protein
VAHRSAPEVLVEFPERAAELLGRELAEQELLNAGRVGLHLQDELFELSEFQSDAHDEQSVHQVLLVDLAVSIQVEGFEPRGGRVCRRMWGGGVEGVVGAGRGARGWHLFRT